MIRDASIRIAVVLATCIYLVAAAEVYGRNPSSDGGNGSVRIETRFVDGESGLEAEWGSTGQILLPPLPGDDSVGHWRGARSVATSSSRQNVEIQAGGRATIRIGREIPYAGWFLRHRAECDPFDSEAEWRDVESSVEIQAAYPGMDGTVRLELIPEFGLLQGRTRLSVACPDLRVEIPVPDGGEVRFTAPAGREDFFKRFFAGYDPLRRVRGIDLILRVIVLRSPVP